jgi:hypothetical protein
MQISFTHSSIEVRPDETLDSRRRTIRRVNDGTINRFEVTYVPDNAPWYLSGSLGRGRVYYENQFDQACPINAARYFLTPIQYFCQAITFPRVGQRSDTLNELDLRLGWEFELVEDALALFAEAGYRRLQVVNDDDFDMRALAGCNAWRREQGPAFGIPAAGCVPVSTDVDANGAVAALGLAWTPWGERFVLSLRGDFVQRRYVIWRNDVATRFVRANCDARLDGTRCPVVRAFLEGGVIGERPGASWTWASLDASYRIADGWRAHVGFEGRGTRDWDVWQLGVSYTF